MLDAVIWYLPAPIDVPDVGRELDPSDPEKKRRRARPADDENVSAAWFLN